MAVWGWCTALVGDQRTLTVPNDSDLRSLRLRCQQIDRMAQFRGTLCEPGAVNLGKTDCLLTVKSQYLSEAAELPQRSKAAMYQNVNRLARFEMQASVRDYPSTRAAALRIR
jgi:hypothetical protein